MEDFDEDIENGSDEEAEAMTAADVLLKLEEVFKNCTEYTSACKMNHEDQDATTT